MCLALRQRAGATAARLLALLGALVAALPATTALAQDHERVLKSLAPHERQVYLQRLAARQRTEAGSSLDVNGPVLTGFNAQTTLDLDKPATPFKVIIKATDDLSGVTSATFYAFGPRGGEGQQVSVVGAVGYPLKSLSVAGGIGNLNRMLEPGRWKFAWGYGYDAAGNYSYFDEAMLDALGNTVFTIVNSDGHDIAAPTLVSGDIMTATVSLSSVVPGTTTRLPYVKIKVNAADTGNSALAGVRQVVATFCKLGAPTACVNAAGATFARGQAKASLYVGTELTAGAATGTYELKDLLVYDHADNLSDYHATAFGGTTDFGFYFPGGTSITIKP